MNKSITMVLCNKRNLTKVPTELPNNTVLLDLSGNNIKRLGNGSFKGYPDLKNLTVAQNKLTQIKIGDFEGLQELQFLSLRNNSIRYNSSGFQPGSFKPLVNLEKLNIQENFTRNDYRRESYDLEALSDLKRLKILFLDGMPGKNLAEVFQSLTSLREIKFNGNWGRCLLWKMTPNFFPYNMSLTHITIQNCEIKNIEKGTFERLTHLLFLDLSYNEELSLSSMANLSSGLNTNMETLRASKLYSTLGPCVTLTKEILSGFAQVKLKEVYLESNRISTIEKEAVKYIPGTLETISMRDNILTMDMYVFYFLAKQTFSNLRQLIIADQYKDHVLPHFQFPTEFQTNKRTKRGTKTKLLTGSNLSSRTTRKETMDVSNVIYESVTRSLHKETILNRKTDIDIPNNLPFMKRHSRVYGDKVKTSNDDSSRRKENVDNEKEQAVMLTRKLRSWMSGYPIVLPGNFTKLDASNNKIRLVLTGFNLTVPNSLRERNISRNLYWAWVGPFWGFRNLTKLDMSWNFCSYMNLSVFKDMPSLETLNLSRNYLDTSLSVDQKGTTFQNQGKLTTLVMSENKLRTLPINIFKGLKDLKELNLARNLLKTFEIDLSHMSHLHILNLYDNQLETIHDSARKVFDQQAHAANFSLNLGRNNFKCDCANLDFIEWISVSPVKFQNFKNYVCYFKDRTKGKLTNAASIYQTLAEECTNYTPVIVSSTAALVLILSLTAAATVYRYRWNLRYLYYMTKYKAKTAMPKVPGYEPIEAEDDLLETVNVSYADEDCGFVRQKIYTELEVNRGLKLHIRDRDNPVDERFVSDNIMDAIESTRKTLIIMSKAYLKHRWCIFEMNMAGIKALKTDKDMLCVLLLEEVPHKDLPLKIMKIIKDQEYIEYPGDDNLQDCFWDRLKDALTD